MFLDIIHSYSASYIPCEPGAHVIIMHASLVSDIPLHVQYRLPNHEIQRKLTVLQA